jgi:hypothetical protein
MGRRPLDLALAWTYVVRPPGFEPGTCGLRVRCSAVELEARADLQPYPDGGGAVG